MFLLRLGTEKNDILIEWPLYILGYKYVAMLLLPFEAHFPSLQSYSAHRWLEMSFVSTFVAGC